MNFVLRTSNLPNMIITDTRQLEETGIFEANGVPCSGESSAVALQEDHSGSIYKSSSDDAANGADMGC